jgi:hypothetical protein
MTDEEYEVLSELPEDEVVFTCRQCEPPSIDAPWRKAIREEMLAGMKGIFAQFSKQTWAKVLLNTHSKDVSLEVLMEGLPTVLKCVCPGIKWVK